MGRSLKQALWVFFIALLVVCVLTPQAQAAYGYRMPITINKTQVQGSLSNFPVLISITSANLKTEINGGHVQNSNGYDIVFRASDGTTALPHEVESYIGLTGQIIAWVKVPTISSAVDTLIYAYYGDTSVSSSTQNITAVWDNNFIGVWHLTNNFNDSTLNANNGTNSGSLESSGKIANARNLDGVDDYISVPNTPSLAITSALTIEGWVKLNSFGIGTDVDPIIRKGEGNPNNYQLCIANSKLSLKLDENDDAGLTGGTALSAGAWYYVVGAWDGATRRLFLNGVEDGFGSRSGSIGTDVRSLYIGGRSGAADIANGIADEVRLSNVARSVGWIQTSFNNQSNPGTFHTLGAEQNIGAPVTYQITAVAGSNGSLSPSGMTTVIAGSNQIYTVTPAAGYEVNQVLVDGSAVSLVAGQYTFTNVNANHTISASFSAVVVDPSDPPPPTVPGCGQNLNVNYGATGFNDADFNLISVGETASRTLQLNTGYYAIDPNNIVIPFTQEVSVTFMHELAGYRNEFGWLLASEGINGTKHPIYTQINDDDHDGVLDDFEPSSDVHVNRKVIGTFTGGTEIVFYLKVFPQIGGEPHGDPAGQPNFYLFTKKDWNADTYNSYKSAECSADSFTKTIYLDQNYAGGSCAWASNWMDSESVERANTYFDLDFVGASPATMSIVRGQKFPHVVVGVPANKPNEWVLGWEDLYNGGDMDFNDLVFVIERRTGGHVQPKNPITPNRAEDYFTAVTAQIWDRIPCSGKTDVKYYVSIDNGANWVEVTDWDDIWETNASKTDIQQLASWTPGAPQYTRRTVRLDFAGLGLTGRQLTWKAEITSNQQGCEPEIIDVKLDADIASHAFFSRGSPVVKANVIYSGYYETPAMTWLDKSLRGHLSATRLYAPNNPNVTDELALWDAGQVLSTRNPATRVIYFPEISTGQMSNLEIGVGDGTAVTFMGTISPVPISATTLTITDGRESFRDKHTNVLEGSLGGTGTINRFTGEFSLTFNEAPLNGATLRASYSYYAAASALKAFIASHVNKAVMGLDNSSLIPSGYVYDFDGDNDVDDNDAHWLMNWVRGYELGTAVKREWLLDAVDHSVPAVQTAPGLPLWYFGTATTEPERTAYDQFMAAYATRRAVVYVGSRSGMLHAFDAGAFRYGDNPETSGVTEHRGYFAGGTPDYGTGAELWAFIPANLLPRMKNNLLARQNKARAADYDQAYVDASPAIADVYINGAWRTVLLSAEGNGGDTVFCLDVTDPANPGFLWEFADPDLYRSRSSPSVARIGRILLNGTAKWVAFFVSGNDSRYDLTQYPSVYMIDIANGAVLQRIFLNAEPSGIGGVPSGQPTIVDSDGNGYIDRFYIGTDKGFLYKANIPDDPSSLKYAISHCAVNKDYTDVDGNTIASDRRYQPIYGSPVVVVDNTINEAGGLNYNVRIFYGTGDSPYYDEDINTAGTRYHFLAYVDTAKKGVCSDAAVSLDWYYELPEGHRVFASAFAAAGTIYFGTSTAETEDPCAADSQSNNNGEIFAIAISQPTASVTPVFHQKVGNTVTPPLVEDQHLYIKNQSGGLQSFGSGRYNNEVLTGGFPQVKVKMWKEIF
jgi:hypothetical protein